MALRGSGGAGRGGDRTAGAGGTVPDVGDLDGEELRALCARGRAAWPALAVGDEAFARFLTQVAAGGGAGAEADPSPLAERVIDDLYLACACVLGVPGAAAAFDERCASAIRAAVARIARSADDQEEIVQAVRDAVLVGRPGAPPKIAGYTGRGALPRWVGVTGQRLALMMLRSEKAEARARDGLAAEAAPPADPQVGYMKEHYRNELEEILGGLLEELSDRERILLRLSLLEGQSAERIGKIYGVSRATAQRWIEDVRARIGDGVRQRIALSSSGIGSVAALVASQLDLSLARVLRPR